MTSSLLLIVQRLTYVQQCLENIGNQLNLGDIYDMIKTHRNDTNIKLDATNAMLGEVKEQLTGLSNQVQILKE